MTAQPGCPMCKALTSRAADVHPDHITHESDAAHHVECPDPPCTHYGQGAGQ
ncbi:hypothetical protein Krad_1736 [Kineococcus radiotolerans SRS30216 = ATCC BAA-149]|uniref:Uncharacterized protein n=1 Tax=Kineococcus radiotolerans (strain ATCC BAA-149 / DSM 14245 / SRS30216) TaxID=266940 RepID=A6W8T3_KINRD|nr:hypothetical protein Krad_1736 [Kineococcus radiotolerans SRS30216 = ATCC BAA-149]